MSFYKKEFNRLIITSKGLDVSKDIQREISNNPFQENLTLNQATLTNLNYPYGYQGQLQSRYSIQVINKPIKSQFLQTDANYKKHTNNSSLNLQGINDSTLIGSANNLLSSTMYGGGGSKGFGDKAMRNSFCKSRSGEGTSTFNVVNNKNVLKNQISVDSLGGLKLNIKNMSYQNEVNHLNELQKQQMMQVSAERKMIKYNQWNDQFVKSNEVMKNKYYQKHEEMNKLADKDNEVYFWNQWKELKETCQQTISQVEQENNRYEDRVIRSFTKKYKKSFQSLPTCAKTTKDKQKSTSTLPKIESSPFQNKP